MPPVKDEFPRFLTLDEVMRLQVARLPRCIDCFFEWDPGEGVDATRTPCRTCRERRMMDNATVERAQFILQVARTLMPRAPEETIETVSGELMYLTGEQLLGIHVALNTSPNMDPELVVTSHHFTPEGTELRIGQTIWAKTPLQIEDRLFEVNTPGLIFGFERRVDSTVRVDVLINLLNGSRIRESLDQIEQRWSPLEPTVEPTPHRSSFWERLVEED